MKYFLTFWSRWITFPEWMYFVALSNWYMMKRLWISFKMVPRLITLCKSVSANIHKNQQTNESMKNNNMLIYSEILPISSASFMCFLVAYHSNKFWSYNMEQKVLISCKSKLLLDYNTGIPQCC